MRKTQKFSPSKHDKRKSQQQARATCRMKTILQQQQQQQSPELGCFDNMAKVFPNMRCMCGWPFPPPLFSHFFFSTPTSISLHVHIENRPGGYILLPILPGGLIRKVNKD